MTFQMNIQELTDLLAETLVRKNADYGDSFGKSYDKYGDVMIAIRLSDKMNRFENLITSKEQLVSDESIDDTLLDIAGYAVLALEKRRGFK